ncbi:MAG: chemotaxis protein CheB [Chloroflexota bacterium]|nr:chemotaxis protein CheB [Chloroflexota bacterium]
MPGHDIVVIGASAGGVEALMDVVRALPPDLPAALFVVLHVPPDHESMLPRILSHAGPLPAIHPKDGDRIEHGTIYVAPPDYHLLVEQGRVRVVRGPRENRYRPAVDPLFRSAAQVYGPRVIGVVLSGMLDDGAAGLVAIHARGGIGVVQDPDDALFPGMPTSAMRYDHPAYLVPATEIGPLLARLVHESARNANEKEDAVPDAMEKETAIAALDMGAISDRDKPGKPSAFGCPECGGVLWEMQEGPLMRYRCRVGHAYSADSLLSEQSLRLEAALWAALRGLEEKAALVHRLADRARDSGHGMLTARYAEQERDAQRHAAVIRELILRGDTSPADTGTARQQETADG